MEVEPSGQRGRTATGSGRNGNETVNDGASEAFAMWLHYLYVPRRTAVGGT